MKGILFMKVRSYLFLFLPTLFISIITTGEIQPPPGAEPTPVLELDFNSPWMRELIAAPFYRRNVPWLWT